MINFMGNFYAVKNGGGCNIFDRCEIRSRQEIEDEYDSTIEKMRENKEATLAIWDYMHSQAVQNRINALGDINIIMFVSHPSNMESAYVYSDSLPDRVEILPNEDETNKQKVNVLLRFSSASEGEECKEAPDSDDEAQGNGNWIPFG